METIEKQKGLAAREPVAMAILAAALGNIIWGFSYLFTRLAQQVAAPDVLLSVRFSIATLLMTAQMAFGREKITLKGKRVGPLLMLGVTELLYFYCESYGIYHTNSTFAGVVLAAVPVVSMALAAVFLKEYPTRRQALFCFLPIIGVAMITVSGSAMGIVTPIGAALVFGACLCAAVYKTINRRAAEDFTPFERTFVVLLMCAVVFTISALRTSGGDFGVYADALSQPKFLVSVVMLSVFCSVTANMLVNYATGALSVVKLATFSALTTLCSMFAGIFFLHEPFTPASMAGAALILVGIWQVTKSGT